MDRRPSEKMTRVIGILLVTSCSYFSETSSITFHEPLHYINFVFETQTTAYWKL